LEKSKLLVIKRLKIANNFPVGFGQQKFRQLPGISEYPFDPVVKKCLYKDA